LYFRQPHQVKKLHYDLPRFDGLYALEWIFSADQYFDYYNIPDLERIVVSAMHMDKGAIPWFQMMQRNQPFRSWHELKRAIEIEFGPSLFDCPRASLFKLMQVGSVNEYYPEFTALANRAHIEPPEALLDCFITGLKLDIRRDVVSQCPSTLLRALALAKLNEEKYTMSFSPSFVSNITKTTIQPVKSPLPHRINPKSTLPPLLPTPNVPPSKIVIKK